MSYNGPEQWREMREKRVFSVSRYQLKLTEQPEKLLYGLHRPSGDRQQRRDIPDLAARFYRHLGVERVLPFYVVSRDYDRGSGRFTLFVGDDGSNRALETELLPAGTYARLRVRPMLGFLWGPAVGAAKRWFYTGWLPKSAYEAVNLEYELHTEKTVGRHPTAELLFALRKRG